MCVINKATPGSAKRLVELKENGCKFITIDALLAPSVTKSDEWVPIRPGSQSDLAFILAVVEVIVNEMGADDVGFLKKRTNVPYLIKPDGTYLRADGPLVKDIAREDQMVGPPLIWDSVDKTAKTFNDKTLKDYALEGTYTVNGVQCKPAFQLLKERVERIRA